jgi:hypothetical protein
MAYFDFRTEPVNENPHECFADTSTKGTQVVCNYIHCNYIEEFDSMEDAETAMGIHEEQTEHQEVPLFV